MRVMSMVSKVRDMYENKTRFLIRPYLETSNMLIMTLAYSQISGNGTFIDRHYNMLREWGYYLGNNSLLPTNQYVMSLKALIYQLLTFYRLWSDAIRQGISSINNQSNIALKGIIGIAAMSELASIAGRNDDSLSFNASNPGSFRIFGVDGNCRERRYRRYRSGKLMLSHQAMSISFTERQILTASCTTSMRT